MGPRRGDHTLSVVVSTGRGVLSTDQYQLTMAQLYYRCGFHERPVRFEHFYRSNPDYGSHQAGYCVAAGLSPFVRWMTETYATDDDIAKLRTRSSVAGGQLFADDFLAWLSGVGFGALSLDAVPEGRVVHPNTPITTVEGPLAMAQLVETQLLNQLNFQTLIASKTSRVVEASRGRPVLEFGMRRAANAGADAASRASIVGGAVSTSNAAVGYDLGVAPAGTHAHSMVQLFMALGEGERAAFEAYADVYPDDCLLLVDTIDTLRSGIPNAIAVFEQLRRRGHRPLGIRLDSGDLAHLAIESARQLDAAGFDDTTIVLSSQLDELAIWQILTQIEREAPTTGVDADRLIGRLTFGVGSRLATSDGAPSLDGVYKLVAAERDGSWVPAMKRSDTPSKVLNPGSKRLWRVYDQRGVATADVMSTIDETLTLGTDLRLHHHARADVSRMLDAASWSRAEAITVPVVRDGAVVFDGGRSALDDIDAARQRRAADVEQLDAGVRRLVNPHVYHVSITDGVHELKRSALEAL